MGGPSGIDFLVDFFQRLFIQIGPVDHCACFVLDQMRFFGAQSERRVGKRVGIEILDHREAVVDHVLRLFLRVHQIVEKHSVFAVEFRRHEVHAEPLGDRADDAVGRRADDQIVRPFLREIPRGDLLFVFVPVTLDLFVEVIHHRQIAEEFALHLIFRHYSCLTKDDIPDRFRGEGEPHLRARFHAPEAKPDRAIRRENRSVKIIYIHFVLTCFFLRAGKAYHIPVITRGHEIRFFVVRFHQTAESERAQSRDLSVRVGQVN